MNKKEIEEDIERLMKQVADNQLKIKSIAAENKSLKGSIKLLRWKLKESWGNSNDAI